MRNACESADASILFAHAWPLEVQAVADKASRSGWCLQPCVVLRIRQVQHAIREKAHGDAIGLSSTGEQVRPQRLLALLHHFLVVLSHFHVFLRMIDEGDAHIGQVLLLSCWHTAMPACHSRRLHRTGFAPVGRQAALRVRLAHRVACRRRPVTARRCRPWRWQNLYRPALS